MQSSATANPILQAFFIQFMQDAKEFVGRTLFPVFPTPIQSANYYTLDPAALLNNARDTSRAPASPYSRSRTKIADDTYSCKEYGHEEPVDDRERKKYQNFLDADKVAVRRIVQTMLVNYELRAQSKVATNVTGVNPVALWSDYSTSNPILDVDTGREQIHSDTGMDPNVIVIPRTVFNVVKEHPIVRDHYKFTSPGSVTPEMIARLFRIDNLVVAGGLQNNANEGQTINPGPIWGNDVILAKVDDSLDMSAPSFGRTFLWTAETGPEGWLVESYRQDNIRSDIHRARGDSDEKVQIATAAYRLASVI